MSQQSRPCVVACVKECPLRPSVWCVSLCLCSVSRVDLFSIAVAVAVALLRFIVSPLHFLDKPPSRHVALSTRPLLCPICVRLCFWNIWVSVSLCLSVSVCVRLCLSAAVGGAALVTRHSSRHFRRRLLPLPSPNLSPTSLWLLCSCYILSLSLKSVTAPAPCPVHTYAPPVRSSRARAVRATELFAAAHFTHSTSPAS